MRLERLRALEKRYDGPIPPDDRDAALHATPISVRAARQRLRFHRRSADDAIAASARWRSIAADGGYAHLPQAEITARRIALTIRMLDAAGRHLVWRLHLRSPDFGDRDGNEGA